MVSDFLGALSDQMSSQFSLGENKNNTLDAGGVKYGALGDFAQKFDQSAQRSYVEEGYLRTDPYNAVPKQFEILTQQPNATILVKKRMFSSLAESFRPDFMDADEKMYYRAIKILFQNKCNQIANLEKLSKIQKITSIMGQIDNYMIPLIISLTDSYISGLSDTVLNSKGENDTSKLVQTVDRLRRIYAYNITSPLTNWVVDNTNLMKSQYAEGTGVLEITNFTNISTNLSVDSQQTGSANFTIYDPYQAMLVTEYDIEKAIADATNLFYRSKTFQLGKENAELLINEMQTRLNQYRAERGVSPITFTMNPDTLLGKRVTAIIDKLGESIQFEYDGLGSLLTLGFKGEENVGVTVSPEYLKDGAIAGINGLDTQKKKFVGRSWINDNFNTTSGTHLGPDSEVTLFCRIIKAIFDRLTLSANANNSFKQANKKTNYARRKLRFNFLGKLIIQPMDPVHIYLSSNSKFDNRLLGGLGNMFTGMGVMQKMAQGLTDFKNAWNTVFNPDGNVTMQIEKAAFVGSSFPSWIWASIRSQFVNENEGVHVFGGLVDGASDSWSGGKYTVDVKCSDNTHYFDLGRVNFNPGVDVYNGTIFESLTPFKSNFDSITSDTKSESLDFLEENEWLLSESINKGKSVAPIVKHKFGPSFGLPITAKSIVQDKSIDPLSGLLTRTVYAPDGLVYKWKEGISTLVQSGSYSDFNDAKRVGIVNINKDPFAGQDVMNVLSLLITGTPYNFATYWKAVGAPNYSGDPNANTTAANTYYESIRKDLTKNNLLWGNFIPFKNLVIDESTYAQKLQGQFEIVEQNSQLNDKLRRLQVCFDEMKVVNLFTIFKGGDIAYDTANTASSPSKKLQSEIDVLQTEITKLSTDIANSSAKSNKAYYSFDDDVSFDVGDDIDSNIGQGLGATDKPISKSMFRKMLRKQLNNITRRMSYNVRGNEDKNLFIVDDSYDKDYDIMAYNQPITGVQLFNNSFISIKESIQVTAGLLNLEVFCDTQGHIRVRSPQYNRIPSSVFYRMMYLKDSTGVQVFPQFLNDMFKTQLETLKLQIEIIEDYIRLDCAILGYNNDFGAAYGIQTGFADSKAGSTAPFYFISNQNGAISDINKIITSANPDLQVQNESLEAFSAIQSQAVIKQDIFKVTDRALALIQILTKKRLSGAGYSLDDPSVVKQNTVAEEIAQRISLKSGIRVRLNDYIAKKDKLIVEGAEADIPYSVDVFKTLSELGEKIKERQKVVKLFYRLIKSCREYSSLDNDSSLTNKLLNPGSYRNTNIPEVFEHMIEDESYDDLGPGSGKRYIIRRSQIINMSFSEQPPPFTAVEVQGTLNTVNPDQLPPGLKSFPKGGNGMTTAMALDYDLWRNYGFRDTKAITVPFLQNPETQCAPYATMLLSRARKDILRGSVTISGNEFMQPGDVVYIEDRGLLFYVSSVRHAFTFGTSFRTTLDLTYGHAPGEYIPTPLDIMGKMIYNNRDLNNIVMYRQTGATNEESLGILLYDPNSGMVANQSNKNNYLPTAYDKENMRTINNILYKAQNFINNNKTDDGYKTKITRIELRIYHDGSNTVDLNLSQFRDTIAKTLKGEYDLGIQASYDSSVKAEVPWINDPSALEINANIDLSDETETHSPSQKALSAARDMVANKSSSDGAEDVSGNNATKSGEDTTNNANSQAKAKKKRSQLRSMLFKYIVDCWLVYEDVVPKTGS